MITTTEPHHLRTNTRARTAYEAKRDADFEILRTAMQRKIDSASGPLFLAAVPDLYEIFLGGLPAADRQHHQCRACRNFVDRFGGLVTIGDDGRIDSAIWPELPPTNVYAGAVAAMDECVSGVSGAFCSGDAVLGVPKNYSNKHGHDWTHFAVRLPRHLRSSSTAAAVAHERECLVSGLAEYKLQTVTAAVAALRSGQLYRSEKCLGVAEWLERVHASVGAAKGARRSNLLWKIAATAPAGFCHIKSTMIGTLLDDLASGLSVDVAARKFAEKMNPLQYQRPTAPPSLGNIAAAEKVIDSLGLRDSLARRFARIEDCEALWVPVVNRSTPGGGLFDHLKPKAPELTLTAPAMGWAKFLRTVLPEAETIELRLAQGYYDRMNLAAFVTAVNPDAPPLLQWDRPERRNPVSMYLYNGGSTPAAWGLGGSWADVTAITRDPAHWYGNIAPNQADRVFLLLRGAHDIRHAAGGGFFPETLRSELHSIRSTLEAFAQRASIAGRDEATACGLCFGDRSPPMTLRVRAKGTVTTYTIDRME